MKSNDPLSDLFKGAGHIAAPSDLEDRVLAKLVANDTQRSVVAPLFSRYHWIGIAAVIALLAMFTMTQAWSNDPSAILPNTFSWLHIPQFNAFWSSPWVLGIMVTIILLTIMDRTITKHFAPRSGR